MGRAHWGRENTQCRRGTQRRHDNFESLRASRSVRLDHSFFLAELFLELFCREPYVHVNF